MEIKNIYSSFDNYGYEDEKLYSVLMDEDEVALFSEIQKQFGAIKAANKLAKKAWERQAATATGRLLDTPRYISTPNGRTVINPKFDADVLPISRSARRFRDTPTKLTPGKATSKTIKDNLSSAGRFEDLSHARGIKKSDYPRLYEGTMHPLR